MVPSSTSSRRGRKPKRPLPPLAERLVQAREKFGLTQRDLAEQLDCGWRSIQDYEQGRAVPGGKVLAGYRKLGVDLNWLLSDSDLTPQPSENDLVEIPHFQTHEVEADFTAIGSRMSVIQVARSWLEHLANDAEEQVDGRQLASLAVEDGLMAPEVPLGSVIVFDANPIELDAEGLYVLRLGNRLVVRLFRPTLDHSFEIVELKHPARSIVVQKTDRRLPSAYRVIATLSAQATS